MEELPPDPPKKIKEEDEISFKELILQKLTKVESELKDLKSSQFNDRMTITGIGAKVQGIEEVVSSLNLGKLNTNTKESKFTSCKTKYYKPSMVINLSKIG